MANQMMRGADNQLRGADNQLRGSVRQFPRGPFPELPGGVNFRGVSPEIN